MEKKMMTSTPGDLVSIVPKSLPLFPHVLGKNRGVHDLFSISLTLLIAHKADCFLQMPRPLQ